MSEVAIIGTTTWGTTLALVLASKGLQVSLWARTKQEAAKLKNSSNPGLLSIAHPESLSLTTSLDKAVSETKVLLLVVPSQSMRQNIKLVAEHLDESTLIVSAAKGLELGSDLRMSQVIAEEINPEFHPNICVMSGPNLSREVLNELPAATVVASADEAKAKQVQKLLTTPNLCVYTNTDVTGVELGGALKNIIALGAGITDGLGYGDNAKAALITRGLTEMTALGVALGANPLTFSGLAGLGDLIATCSSPLSRNHYVGVELAKGRPLEKITKSMAGIAEGVTTTIAVHELALKLGLEMPITEATYRVLYEGADIRKTAAQLMMAGAAHELAGRKWRLFSFLKRRGRSESS
jgi:glycerol-3-phosphate dehydrogenase (NAD(P)+)